MPGNTANYGFEYPLATDNLSDGAQSIQDFATQVDTAFLDLRGGTTGQYLTKQSNTQMDFQWTNLPTIPAEFPMPETGRYLGTRNFYPYLDTTPNGIGINQVFAMPIFVSEPFTADRISVNATNSGAVGATVRLGIYDSGTNNLPNNLLVDAGTASMTSTGEKELTISTALPAGVVWLVVVGQGSATNNGSIDGLRWVATSTSAYVPFKFDSTFTSYRTRGTFFQRTTTVSGALPATFGSGTWQTSLVYDVAVRRA